MLFTKCDVFSSSSASLNLIFKFRTKSRSVKNLSKEKRQLIHLKYLKKKVFVTSNIEYPLHRWHISSMLNYAELYNRLILVFLVYWIGAGLKMSYKVHYKSTNIMQVLIACLFCNVQHIYIYSVILDIQITHYSAQTAFSLSMEACVAILATT
jgi:hypothetical protein